MEPRTTPAPEPLPGLTVVVPALDEEEGLPLTLRALFEALAALGRASEVIVVDDGSTDRTATIAREMGARVVAHPQPAGYGAALKTGIRLARHPLVAIVDADAAYPVDQLPAMVAQMDRYDMVVAARSGRHYRRRALLSPMRSAFLLLTNFVAGTWIPDPNSGLRVFRRDVALPMLDVLPRAFSFTTTMTLVMTLQGRFVLFRTVPYAKRVGRRKVRLVRDALRTSQTLVEIILRYNPLKLFLLLGALPLVLAALALAGIYDESAAYVSAAILTGSAFVVFAIGMASMARPPRSPVELPPLPVSERTGPAPTSTSEAPDAGPEAPESEAPVAAPPAENE